MTRFETLEEMAFKALKDKGFGPKENVAAKKLLMEELDVVRITDSAEMFLVAEELCSMAKKARLFFDPSSAGGYSMSILCYLLGISIDNPLRYPEYKSIVTFERELKARNLMTFLVYDEGLKRIEKFMRRRYPDAEFKGFIDTFNAKVSATDEYSAFTIHAALDYESSRRERTLASIASINHERVDLNEIPLDDKTAFGLFNSLDWDGVTDNLVFTKVMNAVREQKPETILQLWSAINEPVYHVYGNKGENFVSETFATAVRIYHLAYLKAHYRDAFDSMLEAERKSKQM